MLYLKACPRCRGDVKFADDQYGKYLECLQCGYTIDGNDRKSGARELDERAAVTEAA